MQKEKHQKKIPCRSEHEEQQAIFEWADLNKKKHPELKLLFGSIMGTHISPKLLNKAKKAGMVKGKPDIHLAIPKNEYCGLWIELKRKDGGQVSIQQDEILRLLAQWGHDVYVCKGAEAAISVIKNYLEMGKSKNKENFRESRNLIRA